MEGVWDTIVMTASEQNEALQMQAVQGAACLSPRGQLLVVDRQLREGILGETFAQVRELERGENWSVACCQQAKLQGAMFPWDRVSVFVRGLDLELASLPGNFSPRALDAGTQALLEAVVVPSGGRVLDLACGYGVVGIALAKLGAGEVVYTDDCLVALAATAYNLEATGLTGELVHSHLPHLVQGSFDCILSNPPYHAEYGLAKSFVEFAAGRLLAGGWLYLVVKRPHWYVQKLRSVFGGCHVVEKGGYSVISAQKRWGGVQRTRPTKTTRKHARREERARGRRKDFEGNKKISSPDS